MDVKIVVFPETKVAVLEHHGPQHLEPASIQRFIAWRRENQFPLDKHQNYGLHYNDPRTTPPEDYRVDLCISVEQEVPENRYGVVNKVIPEGRCAVARHVGSREDIIAARFLYEEWLPGSGEVMRDYPILFHYVNVGPGVLEEEMITDVYLPLV